MQPDDVRVVSNFMVQALQNKDITIYGDGRQTRSFCYVDGLVDGLISMIATDDSVTGLINLGNPSEITIAEVAKMIIAITNSKSNISYMDIPLDDPQRKKPDIATAQKILGWSPSRELENGLKITARYFRETI